MRTWNRIITMSRRHSWRPQQQGKVEILPYLEYKHYKLANSKWHNMHSLWLVRNRGRQNDAWHSRNSWPMQWVSKPVKTLTSLIHSLPFLWNAIISPGELQNWQVPGLLGWSNLDLDAQGRARKKGEHIDSVEWGRGLGHTIARIEWKDIVRYV